jgi:hypothetical protein
MGPTGVAAVVDGPYPDDVRCIRVSSSSMHRVGRFAVAGLLAAGLLLSVSVGRGEAKVGAVTAAGTSGYAYSRAATPDSVALINASANRTADGSSSTKGLALVAIGMLVFVGAGFEAVYVRRRGGR